jgi:hypothetical protein
MSYAQVIRYIEPYNDNTKAKLRNKLKYVLGYDGELEDDTWTYINHVNYKVSNDVAFRIYFSEVPNPFKEIVKYYEDFCEKYYNEDGDYDEEYDVFDFFNSADDIWKLSNELKKELKVMLEGEKYDGKNVENDYVNMRKELSNICSDLKDRFISIYDVTSNGFSGKQHGYMKEYSIFKEYLL